MAPGAAEWAAPGEWADKRALLEAEICALRIKLQQAESAAQESCSLVYVGATLLQRYVGWWR